MPLLKLTPEGREYVENEFNRIRGTATCVRYSDNSLRQHIYREWLIKHIGPNVMLITLEQVLRITELGAYQNAEMLVETIHELVSNLIERNAEEEV